MKFVRQLVTAAAGAAAASAFLVYCGGTPTSLADAGDAGAQGGGGAVVRSGTRLRAETFTTPDGASYFSGYWWDAELRLTCRRVDPGNGVLDRRCAPYGVPSTDDALFSDAACAKAVAKAYPDRDATTFCRRGSDFVRLGPRAGTVYKRGAAGACVEAPDALAQTPGATFYACDGELVAPETFVLFSDSRD